MDTKTTPQGTTPVPVGQQIASLQQQIHECRAIQQCSIHKLTIVINGRKGREAANFVLSFPPGSIPLEFDNFMHDYMNRLGAQVQSLQHDVPLIRLGNQIVVLDNFIKDYTAGEIPSIDGDTVNALYNMAPGDTLLIVINEKPHNVQRIS